MDRLPFTYAGFWDVPRLITIALADHRFLILDCPFDDALDDYASAFTAFLLDSDVLVPDGSWKARAVLLRAVAVTDVVFDDTKRAWIASESIAELLAKARAAS